MALSKRVNTGSSFEATCQQKGETKKKKKKENEFMSFLLSEIFLLGVRIPGVKNLAIWRIS